MSIRLHPPDVFSSAARSTLRDMSFKKMDIYRHYNLRFKRYIYRHLR
jgi:hypothetical protein